MFFTTFREPLLSTPYKISVLGLGVGVFLINYVSVLFAIYRRDWAPFRAKQPLVLLAALVSATFWWLGNLQALGMVDQNGVFSICYLWSVWIQIVLGVQLYLTILLFRLLRLYFILVLCRAPEGSWFWSILILSYLPQVIMGLVPFFLSVLSVYPEPIPDFPGDPYCNFSDKLYGNGLLFFVFVQLLLLIFVNYKIAHVRKAFNEHRETKTALWTCVFILLLNFVIAQLKAQNYPLGRMAVCLSNLVACNILLWTSLWGPLFGYVSDKAAY
ncbi:hypothetical protein HDU91_005056, partial [Kappamyces sp. JEL0680]